jgi:pimeloyl-ACP methyl ester carboxylesterase
MDVMLSESETSRFVQAGNLRLHYNDVGSGRPLIFCEGQGAGTSAWVVYHRVLPMLAKSFRCLLLDQPGYGKSDPVVVKGESRSTMYARSVRHFMDALHIDKATIVDMSFGAQTAQVFAIDNPDRVDRLILHASGVPGPTLFGHPPQSNFAFVAMNAAFAKPSLETCSTEHRFRTKNYCSKAGCSHGSLAPNWRQHANNPKAFSAMFRPNWAESHSRCCRCTAATI